MTDLVPADQIERIVGIERHPTLHFGRAVADTETFYILHSRKCKDSGLDLRQCKFSLALDQSLDIVCGWPDEVVRLGICRGLLERRQWSL
jgi:hypothetical protein